MQSIRYSILKHMKIRVPNTTTQLLIKDENIMEKLSCHLCTSTDTSSDEIVDRVIGLVKKFDRIDACKVIIQDRSPIISSLNFYITCQDFCRFTPNYHMLLKRLSRLLKRLIFRRT